MGRWRSESKVLTSDLEGHLREASGAVYGEKECEEAGEGPCELVVDQPARSSIRL